MKLKNTLLASALLSATAFSVNAATELTPEQAAAVKPFDRVVITGRFNAIGEAVKAVSRRADKEGAASFYVVDTSDFGNSGNWRVVADLYKADAEKAEETSNRVINGVVELPKDQAVLIEPFDTVTVQGFYRSQPEVNDAITKAAKAKGAYSFYIVRQIDANQGGNQRITAFIYKKMLRNVSSRARMSSRQIPKQDVQLWLPVAKLRRKLRSRVLRLPHHQVLKSVASLKPSHQKAGVTPSRSRMALKSKN
ncbi:protein YdgH [Escherichia coli]|nr:protein YdgH [Escherichia coli]